MRESKLKTRWGEPGGKVSIRRSDIKTRGGCTKCGARDIGDVWECPKCGATSGFYAEWLGTPRYVTGDPDNPESDFCKYYELVEDM